MKHRILFLDDNKARHRDVKPYTHHDEAFTAKEAIQKLQDKIYHIVFLDHDLGDKEMVSSFGEEETGYTVAKWIAENKPQIQLIVCHSLNPGGRANMSSLLKQAEYNVIEVPFLSLRNSVSQILDMVEVIEE